MFHIICEVGVRVEKKFENSGNGCSSLHFLSIRFCTKQKGTNKNKIANSPTAILEKVWEGE